MLKLSTLLPAYWHNRANKTVLAVSLWLLDTFKCDLDPGFYECRGLFRHADVVDGAFVKFPQHKEIFQS